MTWSASAWVSALRPGGRLAWVELLAYVKAYGVGGRAKGLPASTAARRWSINAKDVSQMMAAAQADGALEIDKAGDWVVVNFGRYQEVDTTAAERMRKHRALRRNVTNEPTENGARAPRKHPLRRNNHNVTDVPSRDRDIDVDSDRDRTAGEHARAPDVAALHVNGQGAPPDFDGYQPTDAQRIRATELRVDLVSALIKWRGKRKAAGARPVDLAGDFDGWLEDEPQYQNGHGAHAEAPARVSPPRYEPPAEPEPDVSPEERTAGLELVKQAVAASRSVPMPPAEIDDPETIARREASAQRQRDLLAAARGRQEEP